VSGDRRDVSSFDKVLAQLVAAAILGFARVVHTVFRLIFTVLDGLV